MAAILGSAVGAYIGAKKSPGWAAGGAVIGGLAGAVIWTGVLVGALALQKKSSQKPGVPNYQPGLADCGCVDGLGCGCSLGNIDARVSPIPSRSMYYINSGTR